MSQITNNALTPQSWKNYQDRYDAIDWHSDRTVAEDLKEALKDAIEYEKRHDPLRTAL